MQHEELIQKYFNNTLTPDESKEVSKRLETNSEFQTLFNEYKDVQTAFQLNEKETLKDYLSTLDQKAIPFYKRLLTNKLLLTTIASCLIIGVFYFNSKNTFSDLFETYYDSYPNVYQPVIRGNEINKNADAFKAYENEDYLNAEQAFKIALEANDDDNIRFYYVMSLLNQNKTIQAKHILDTLKTKEHNFLAEVYWYSALIAIKDKNDSEAIQNLNTVKKLNSNFKANEIIELLNKLK
ncbi:hypothetical protein [Psychroserpens ponticola]|uniref:Tetratricopeptide repeat protein n=1 Tax=Psychroserpens ponticola TaxID=2932268 RepID=A0ABY7RXX5_9FLAO|nr:hypothetical protein [Psychroserpens ponticola]WCO01988.1 hypothetical protein MUN68_000510 [Psychroserpens ponticola]